MMKALQAKGQLPPKCNVRVSFDKSVGMQGQTLLQIGNPGEFEGCTEYAIAMTVGLLCDNLRNYCKEEHPDHNVRVSVNHTLVRQFQKHLDTHNQMLPPSPWPPHLLEISRQRDVALAERDYAACALTEDALLVAALKGALASYIQGDLKL